MAVLPKKDVVVVGYGAAGGPISTELAKAGYSVIALERGANRTLADYSGKAFDTLRFSGERNELVPRAEDMPITFRTDPNAKAAPASNIMASTVGGASVHWSGQSWRFYESDFRLKSHLEELYTPDQLAYLEEDGANIQDWPITYDDLEPYYDKTEYYVGIGGTAGNIQGKIRPVDPNEGNPFEAPRQRDFPFPSLRQSATTMTFREGAEKLGLHPFQSPAAITTEPYTNPDGVERAGCSYCPFCAGHGCWNGSKSSSQSALLPTAEKTGNFELRANSHVTKVNVVDGRAVSVDFIDLITGETHTQPGDIIYLASYTYQNIRLLLNSGITANDQVGKYFINRVFVMATGLFDDRYLNGYATPGVQRQGVDDYNGENFYEGKLKMAPEDFFIAGGFIYPLGQTPPLSAYGTRAPGVPSWGPDYQAYLTENINRYMTVFNLGESLAYESSYMDLDPNYTDRYGMPAIRVTRQAKQNEERMSRFLFERSNEILQAAGAKEIWGYPVPILTSSMGHEVGGARMGTDPSQSVTNRYGQMWDVPNLFVGGGAVFPTIAGHNPTQTIWTLSYWTADAIMQGKVDLADAQAYSQ
jgi:gluconate 2-dehydrogenase alpha chain